MLRVRELAATGLERSSVKAGMTEEREWDIETGGGGDDEGRAWRQDMETEHGDRAWRQDMETGHEGRTWRPDIETGEGRG